MSTPPSPKNPNGLKNRLKAWVNDASYALRLDALTATEAARELARHSEGDLARLALPDLIAPAPPPADWVTPDTLKTRTPATPAAARPACEDIP